MKRSYKYIYIYIYIYRMKDLARLGFIYEDIWYLTAGFRSFSANGVAHTLARFARLSDNETVWLEEDPPPAVDALYLDSSFLH